MALQPWRKAIITRIIDETYNTKRFWLKVPELENFEFEAGQFVTFDLPIHEKINKRVRSYSIASWPNWCILGPVCRAGAIHAPGQMRFGHFNQKGFVP